MIKDILAFGCSFTFGDGVDHLESWPFKLGKRLGVPACNYGKSGCSNKFIASEVFRLVDPDLSKNSLVVVAWTSYIRSSLWDEKERAWDPILLENTSWKPKVKKACEFYFKEMFTDYDAHFTTIALKMSVEAYLKRHGIRYVFLNSIHEEYHYLNVVDQTLHNMRESLDKTHYMDLYNSVYELLRTDREQYICTTDNYHPSIAGHELVANNLVDFIKRNRILEQ